MSKKQGHVNISYTIKENTSKDIRLAVIASKFQKTSGVKYVNNTHIFDLHWGVTSMDTGNGYDHNLTIIDESNTQPKTILYKDLDNSTITNCEGLVSIGLTYIHEFVSKQYGNTSFKDS